MTKKELKRMREDERAAQENLEIELELYGINDDEFDELFDKDV